jgi:hypothetical protein
MGAMIGHMCDERGQNGKDLQGLADSHDYLADFCSAGYGRSGRTDRARSGVRSTPAIAPSAGGSSVASSNTHTPSTVVRLPKAPVAAAFADGGRRVE